MYLKYSSLGSLSSFLQVVKLLICVRLYVKSAPVSPMSYNVLLTHVKSMLAKTE